jgi:hypothetical protein
VSRQLQIGLLATAVLASLAVAGVRIAHAVHGRSRHDLQVPLYGTSLAAEAATLEALRVPPGFRRFHPCVEGACFILPRSLPFEDATARHVVEGFGVDIASLFVKRRAVECVPDDRTCLVEGVVRGEYVAVWVERPEVRNPKRRTARNRRTWEQSVVAPGTEVEVRVLGHCLHTKQCEESKQREAAETR